MSPLTRADAEETAAVTLTDDEEALLAEAEVELRAGLGLPHGEVAALIASMPNDDDA